jgi:hypothetical protein
MVSPPTPSPAGEQADRIPVRIGLGLYAVGRWFPATGPTAFRPPGCKPAFGARTVNQEQIIAGEISAVPYLRLEGLFGLEAPRDSRRWSP